MHRQTSLEHGRGAFHHPRQAVHTGDSQESSKDQGPGSPAGDQGPGSTCPVSLQVGPPHGLGQKARRAWASVALPQPHKVGNHPSCQLLPTTALMLGTRPLLCGWDADGASGCPPAPLCSRFQGSHAGLGQGHLSGCPLPCPHPSLAGIQPDLYLIKELYIVTFD